MTPFEAPDFDAHESVHFFADAKTGLRALIAIHSTVLGPAAGGCRYLTYPSYAAALTDALRLSRGMSFKNALAGLPLGGGKAVIIKTAEPMSAGRLQAFGRAVDSLNGRYVTAEDVGTSVSDMMAIANATRHVSGIASVGSVAGGNPAPKTAIGVFLGLREGWRYLTGSTDLRGVRVAVQGLGGVGYALCQALYAAGAKLLVADTQPARVQQAQRDFAAVGLAPERILFEPADILAPCALGSVLDAQTIPRLSVRLIAGGANNQLSTAEAGEMLKQRGILYAPDFVVNAGGIICVASEYLGQGSDADVMARIERIPLTLREIFARAAAQSMATDQVAEEMARQLLARSA